MIFRHQPPALSPVVPRALAQALRGLLSPDTGPRDRLARQLGEALGVTRVVLTDSGTGALALAMRAAMAATGRSHVALPAYACYDLVTALNGAGAQVVFYDLDPETLGPDPASLALALATRPAAVVVVHQYGVPADLPQILELAEPEGVRVIEDAAQGVGGALRGRPLGSFGHLRVLSFGRGKGVTGGRGGALLVSPRWRDPVPEDLQPPAAGLPELVLLAALWLLARPSLYWLPAGVPALGLGATVYRAPRPVRAMARAALAAAEEHWRRRQPEVEARRANAAALADLARAAGLSPVRLLAGAAPGWLRYPVLDTRGVLPGERRRLAALGIVPGYPRVLPDLPVLPRVVRPLPDEGARQLVARLWTLPTHGLIRAEDRRAMERECRRILAGTGG